MFAWARSVPLQAVAPGENAFMPELLQTVVGSSSSTLIMSPVLSALCSSYFFILLCVFAGVFINFLTRILFVLLPLLLPSLSPLPLLSLSFCPVHAFTMLSCVGMECMWCGAIWSVQRSDSPAVHNFQCRLNDVSLLSTLCVIFSA